MDKNELFTFYILDTPLIIYIFLLVLLTGICLKWLVFKSLKIWHIIFSPILLCTGIFAFWALKSHNPSYKRYTVDKQYSYYLEEYNFNIILKKRNPRYYTKRHKAFLFDEIGQKILHSKHLGKWLERELPPDCWGFTEEENRFYFTESNYYDLPRPIDKSAIELRERIESSKVYLDWYIISPLEKLVYVELFPKNDVITEEMLEDDWKNGPEPDYMPQEEINYDTTSLIFIGSTITFKEYFPIKSVDISSLKLIDYSYYNRMTILSPLEKKIYIIKEFNIVDSYDLDEYTPVKQQTEKEKKNIRSGLKRLPDQNMVDWESLQVVNNGILVDKNNIYKTDDAIIKVIPIKDLGLDVKIIEML